MTRREKFEATIRAQQGTHGMLGDLVRNADGEYRSACERSAWWAWNTALGPVQCRECSGTGGIERMEVCVHCEGTGKGPTDE